MSKFPPSDILSIVQEIAQILRNRHQTLAISEAACGGLILAYLVSEPGASDFFLGGKLVYSLRQRLKLSGLNDDEIKTYMGPLEAVVLKLARTTKYELGSTYVLSETGFAGPTTDLHLRQDNDQGKVDVGTVFLGVSGPSGDVSCKKETGSSVRAENMEEFARLGLTLLLDTLKKQ